MIKQYYLDYNEQVLDFQNLIENINISKNITNCYQGFQEITKLILLE